MPKDSASLPVQCRQDTPVGYLSTRRGREDHANFVHGNPPESRCARDLLPQNLGAVLAMAPFRIVERIDGVIGRKDTMTRHKVPLRMLGWLPRFRTVNELCIWEGCPEIVSDCLTRRHITPQASIDGAVFTAGFHHFQPFAHVIP